LGAILVAQGYKLETVTLQLKPLADRATLQGPLEQGTVGFSSGADVGFVGRLGQANNEVYMVVNQKPKGRPR